MILYYCDIILLLYKYAVFKSLNHLKEKNVKLLQMLCDKFTNGVANFHMFYSNLLHPLFHMTCCIAECWFLLLNKYLLT